MSKVYLSMYILFLAFVKEKTFFYIYMYGVDDYNLLISED
jgi:hypothetical protein